MKPLLLKVQDHSYSSFDIRHEKLPYFHNPWHFHPEIELTLVIASSGIRFIGDNIAPFEAGDLVLLGANLPHNWRNSDSYYCKDSTLQAEAIIMRFRQDLWGQHLMNTPEMLPIKSLLKRAELGIHFELATSEMITPLLRKTLSSEGTGRLVLWFQIFEMLANTDKYRCFLKNLLMHLILRKIQAAWILC